ncbi:MAG: hypothetical protein ACRDCN_08030 [Tannerellaceae bacterium]
MKQFVNQSLMGCLLLSSVMAFSSCNTNGSKEQTPQTEVAAITVLQVDDVLGKASNILGEEIEVEGVCTHICKHGGRKIFLMGSDDTRTIRIEAGKEIGKFGPETLNNIVRVKGTLVEERIDEAYLQRWEAQVANQAEEKHGTSEAGCSSEQKARNEQVGTTVNDRIAAFRKRIAERKEKEGKEYLSFYHINGTSYQVD